MFSEFIKNLPKQELLKILKDSGVNVIGHDLIELESRDERNYKKTLSIEKYIEEIIDKRNKDRVEKTLEEKCKKSIELLIRKK